jgi:hypothetical protein
MALRERLGILMLGVTPQSLSIVIKLRQGELE